MTDAVRYALYYAPAPQSDLWRIGCALLGRDAAADCDVTLRVPDGWIEEDWRAATAEPRLYGFHATLKAPFRLAPGRIEAGLMDAVLEAGAQLAPVALGRLAVASIGAFLALVPTAPPAPILALAGRIVDDFEPFRAPLSEAERARRRPELLTARQQVLLDRFGYPYVLEEFRFHMTLSGALPAEKREPTRRALQALLDARTGGASERLDRLCLFRQERRDAPFRIIAATLLRGRGSGVIRA